MTTALGMSENLLIPGQRLGFEDVEAGARQSPDSYPINQS